jgi:hypothetical protein
MATSFLETILLESEVYLDLYALIPNGMVGVSTNDNKSGRMKEDPPICRLKFPFHV